MKSNGQPRALLEHMYADVRAGRMRRQLAEPIAADQVVAAFEATVDDLAAVPLRGSFHPEGTRKPLIDLIPDEGAVANTGDLQALLWRPTRWPVRSRPDLDFAFVTREIKPLRIESPTGQAAWAADDTLRHISIDALLVNADDRTPIVAEIKVGHDTNAELALIQALAAAAQLSAASQLKRLSRMYGDHFGVDVPSRLDVYVIAVNPPERGAPPVLAERAHSLASQLQAEGAMHGRVRRIAFLEVTPDSEPLTFDARHVA